MKTERENQNKTNTGVSLARTFALHLKKRKDTNSPSPHSNPSRLSNHLPTYLPPKRSPDYSELFPNNSHYTFSRRLGRGMSIFHITARWDVRSSRGCREIEFFVEIVRGERCAERRGRKLGGIRAVGQGGGKEGTLMRSFVAGLRTEERRKPTRTGTTIKQCGLFPNSILITRTRTRAVTRTTHCCAAVPLSLQFHP